MVSPAGPWRTTTIVDARAETPNAITLRLTLDEPLMDVSVPVERIRVERFGPTG